MPEHEAYIKVRAHTHTHLHAYIHTHTQGRTHSVQAAAAVVAVALSRGRRNVRVYIIPSVAAHAGATGSSSTLARIPRGPETRLITGNRLRPSPHPLPPAYPHLTFLRAITHPSPPGTASDHRVYSNTGTLLGVFYIYIFFFLVFSKFSTARGDGRPNGYFIFRNVVVSY